MANTDDFDTSALLSSLLRGNTRTTGSDDINAFERTLAANNLWKQAATPILSAKLNTSTWTPNQATAGILGQSFVGGLLNALGQQSEANQISQMADIYPQLAANPAATQAPEGVDRAAFGGLKLSMMQDRLQKKFATDEAIRSSLGQRLITSNPDGSVSPTKGSDFIEEMFGKAKGQGSGSNKDIEKLTYDRITNLPQYKILADIDSNFKALPELAKQNTKASDIGLISTIARIRDPNSTVKEGEYQINSDTQSYLDSVAGNWRGVVEGKSRFKPSEKVDIIASVVPKYNEAAKSYTSAKNPLIQALLNQGGNPENVPTLDFQPMDIESLRSQVSGGGASGAWAGKVPEGAVATNRTYGGKPAFKLNGKWYVP